MPDRVRSSSATTGRGSFAILQAEPGHGVCEGYPALLIPGYTGSKEDFLPVLEPLSGAGRQIAAMDLRGQYQSPHAPSRVGYAPGELAADVLAVGGLLDTDPAGAHDSHAAGRPGVHLVGHSMGGLIARHAALLRTGQVLSLTLLSSGPGTIPGQRAAALRETLKMLDPQHDGVDPGSPWQGRNGDRTGADGDDREQLGRIVAEIWRERLEPQARQDGVPDRIIAFLKERTHRTCPVGLIVMGRFLLDCPDRTDELAALSRPAGHEPAAVPVLVIYGEDDDAWPPSAQDRMARRLGAERACIPGAAHSPAIEAPETTARTLTTFWNAVEQRRHTPHRSA